MTLEIAILIGLFLSGCALGALVTWAVFEKRGYTECHTMRVGWCVIDDDDAILGYAKGPDDYAAIMRGKEYATAHPMFIKLED
jgi:hypothetical protein